MWQDYVVAIGGVIFSIALIPAVMHAHKPPLSTSVSTFIILYVFSATFLTLHLWFSSATQFVTGSFWLTLAIQKYFQKRAK